MTRLLVVEDELKLASALEEGLRQAQYTVDLALDGEDALAFARTSSYDAIVLDVLLPEVDGLEICRRLRESDLLTPILLLTALDAVEDKIAGLDCGADDYLTKPFAFDELLARIRALLRRNSPQKEGVLRLADLSLDPASQLVRRGEQTVDLTDREYRVLEFLMRRPGWVVSREAITDSVWGFDSPESSNLIDVYIGRLRRKLGQGAPFQLIQTVRGAGFRIQSEQPGC